jgi:hypothetical protein
MIGSSIGASMRPILICASWYELPTMRPLKKSNREPNGLRGLHIVNGPRARRAAVR